jgi:hypothetical protein
METVPDPEYKRPTFLDAPRWMGGGSAEFLSVALAFVGFAAALGVAVPPIFALAGMMSPTSGTLVSTGCAVLAVGAWLAFRAAQRRAIDHCRVERGLVQTTFNLGGEFVGGPGMASMARVFRVRLEENGLVVSHQRAPVLAIAGYVLANLLLQTREPLGPTWAELAVIVLLWGFAAWCIWPVRKLTPWTSLEAGVVKGSRILLVLDGAAREADFLSLTGTRTTMERLTARLTEHVPLDHLPDDRAARRTTTPVSPRKPAPPRPPNPTLDARKQRELAAALERLSKL